MDTELLEKLMEWVNARLEEKAAVNTSDGGISEYLARAAIEKELRALVKSKEENT